jgi:hypothetical protein
MNTRRLLVRAIVTLAVSAVGLTTPKVSAAASPCQYCMAWLSCNANDIYSLCDPTGCVGDGYECDGGGGDCNDGYVSVNCAYHAS